MSHSLTPTETAAVTARGGNPADYVAVPVDLQFNPSLPSQMATIPGPNGQPVEVVIVPYVLALPAAMLRISTLLNSSGHAPHPLEGFVPMISGGRLVLPRRRLAPPPARARLDLFGLAVGGFKDSDIDPKEH